MQQLLEISCYRTIKVRIHGLPGRASAPYLVEERMLAEAADVIERYKVFCIEVRTALAELRHNRIIVRNLSMKEVKKYRELGTLS